jgi:glycerol-3-phosphate dehydrogenase (NAD(P)+)
VVGGGAWGTALAIHLARLGLDVQLWMLETDLVERMLAHRDNPVYLPGVVVPQGVRPTDDLGAAVAHASVVVAVVPTQYARSVYVDMAPHLDPRCPVVVANKGIEEESLNLPTQVAADTFGGEHPSAVIAGPSFADEFARESPTTIVAASGDPDLARRIQDLFSGRNLRLYTNDDPVGVQLAGALKNVFAIAAGAVDGLGMGHNSLAAVMTRGLAEMTRLGMALGCKAETFSGLAGLGDLILTCTGNLSRNRAVGRSLGRGERLEDILARTRSVAEGVRTTRSARDLALRVGVEMPIVEEVHRALFEGGTLKDAVARLMARPLRSER